MNSADPELTRPESPASRPLVVLTTMPDEDLAHALAKTLIEARLAGCVQVLPPMVSHYEWQGELCRESECLVLIKTTATAWECLLERLQSEHPYEVPQIVALGAQEWSAAYGAWLHGQILPVGPGPRP